MAEAQPVRPAAAPFWLSLGLVPMVVAAAGWGGWALLLPPAYAWALVGALDAVIGRTRDAGDPDTPESHLVWHRAITMLWAPVQAALIFGTLAWLGAGGGAHLAAGERAGLFFGIGIASGTVGIVYAHELIHRAGRVERWLGDILLAMALYSHFRSEHLRVHHVHVATPRDAVTARYNEGFHRFFARVLAECPGSAFRAESRLLARAGRPWWHRSNPFWRYLGLQGAALALAAALAGWQGLGLFAVQAVVAVWQLELTNYVEHYGLTRKHLGEGRYEPVRPRHSWNADHRASNSLLINLQRHADHHIRPGRRFPLLQSYDDDEAPQLPLGYPVMGAVAMIPPLWRRRMNPRVRAWRRRFYPEITDWSDYNRGATPLPRGG